jgi:hypothetical protein
MLEPDHRNEVELTHDTRPLGREELLLVVWQQRDDLVGLQQEVLALSTRNKQLLTDLAEAERQTAEAKALAKAALDESTQRVQTAESALIAGRTDLDRTIEQMAEMKDQIYRSFYSSFTWRTGRVVSAPIRLVARLSRK